MWGLDVPLTDRQRRAWASAPVGEIGRTGLTLTHSAFQRPWHLTNQAQGFEGQTSLGLSVFETHPFEVARPEVSADGRADLRLNIFNSGAVFTGEILAAARKPDEEIRVEVNDYLPGDPISQIEPIILGLGKLALTSAGVSGVATSIDFLNMPFPRGVYRASLFRGLVR